MKEANPKYFFVFSVSTIRDITNIKIDGKFRNLDKALERNGMGTWGFEKPRYKCE